MGELDQVGGLNQFFEELSGQTVQRLSTDDIISAPQSREIFEDIEELAESILAVGQLQPIIVTHRNSAGKHVIRSGERRWRACRSAGIPVDAIVTEGTGDDAIKKASELVENIQRNDLKPLEIARGIQAMLDMNASQSDVSKLLGKTRTYVSIHLGLLKLPEEAKALAEEKIVTDADTLNNLRKLADQDTQLFLQVCLKAREEGLTRAESRNYLAQAKGPANLTVPAGNQDSTPPTDTDNGTKTAPQKVGVDETDPVEEKLEDVNSAPVGNEFTQETAPGDETGAIEPTPANLGEGTEQQATKPTEKKAAPVKAKRGTGWTELAHEDIVWQVLFVDSDNCDEEGTEHQRMGYLLTQRVDDDPAFLWLQCDNEPLRVAAEDVSIVHVGPKEK